MSRTIVFEGAPHGKRPLINVSAVAADLKAGSVGAAVAEAGSVGLAALHAQVNSIGRVTGNLASSVVMRVAHSTGKTRAHVEVGYARPEGSHGHLVEYGTLPRTTQRKGIFSSWKKRGKWVGMGTYPQNFLSGKEYVRGMPALYPMQKAMNKARSQMSAILAARMKQAGTEAIQAGASPELKGSAA